VSSNTSDMQCIIFDTFKIIPPDRSKRNEGELRLFNRAELVKNVYLSVTSISSNIFEARNAKNWLEQSSHWWHKIYWPISWYFVRGLRYLRSKMELENIIIELIWSDCQLSKTFLSQLPDKIWTIQQGMRRCMDVNFVDVPFLDWNVSCMTGDWPSLDWNVSCKTVDCSSPDWKMVLMDRLPLHAQPLLW